nr:unnamed protein product [Callosobruchus chinensis]CAH7754316.1 unnamed protein product [Callosobruchus chinensis]
MAQGNAHAARRIYHERFSQRAVPAVRTFIRIHARLSETGSFKRSTIVIGRSAIVRTVQVDEAVLNEIERNPETSTRKIVHELNITHVTEWQILRHQQLYPYHFCNWLRNQILKNPNFLSQVLFTDEACFSGMPLSIFIANHVWSEDNPHAFRVPHTKEAFPDPCSYDIFFIFFRVLFVVKVC